MNVLIVDDEPIIRLGLRTLVEWEQYGFQYAGDAEDGADAWEALERFDIDIVITDLLMPRMDGLELIRRIGESGKDIGIIVLSCMDDFTYVKEAMKRGAKDYILKPTMEPDTLLETLQGVKSELERQRLERRQVLQWQRELESSKQAQLSGRLAAFVQADSAGRQERDDELQRELFGAAHIGRAGSEAAAGGSLVSLLLCTGQPAPVADWSWTGCVAALSLAAGSAVLLMPAAPAADESADAAHSVSEAAAALLSRAAERWGRLPQEPAWFVGSGALLRRIEEVKQAAALHRRQLQERFYSGSRNRLMPFAAEAAGRAGQAAPAAGSLPQECRSDLLRCVASGNAEGVTHQAGELCRLMRELRPAPDKALAFLQELLALAAGYARERGYEGVDSFEEAFVASRTVLACSSMDQAQEVLTDALHMLGEGRWLVGSAQGNRAQNAFIRKAVQYMREHYASPISTLDIAEHVRLSRSYLSDLYGKETGESLSETLTRIRMEEAKRRLRSGEMKVYEVAEAVGFPDAKTFAKTFKRLVGCSPKEFEKSGF